MNKTTLINIPQQNSSVAVSTQFPAAAIGDSTTLNALIDNLIHVWAFQCGSACEAEWDNVTDAFKFSEWLF